MAKTVVSRQAPQYSHRASWLYGKPVLRSAGSGRANWSASTELTQIQKGSGWSAELYGGVQSGDDWAAVYIPVNDMPVPDFTEAYWSWYQTNTETMGLGIVIWVHDPYDFDNRAEVTQLGGASGLDKSSGQNSHEFDCTTTQMFFYGENTTGTNLTAGTQYTWNQFRTDNLFSKWAIYRISFEWGWEASGTFESAFLEEVRLQGINVPLKPSYTGNHKKFVITTKALAAATAYDAGDVLSETASSGQGTDWDFAMGGTGYITSAQVISETTAITPRLVLFLFRAPPTCELDDHAACTAPLAADLANCIGQIEFPAMIDRGTGMSYAMATPSTYGNIPLMFDTPTIYGVLVTLDAFTQTATDDMSVILGADMED